MVLIVVSLQSLYSNKCPLIEEAYKDTQKALYDADYFNLVDELQFSGKPKSSGSVRVSGGGVLTSN